MKKCIKYDGLGLLNGEIICPDCLGFGKVEGEEAEVVVEPVEPVEPITEEVKKNDEEVSPVSSEVSSEVPVEVSPEEVK